MSGRCQLNQIDIGSLIVIVIVVYKCKDGTLTNMLVQIENIHKSMYHIAFFTKWLVQVEEELTWDYGIDFFYDDHDLPYFAYKCRSSMYLDRQSQIRSQNKQEIREMS